MAATPKHRRSSSKAASTKASNRYDKLLNKFRSIKKHGGNFLMLLRDKSGKLISKNRIHKDNTVHKEKQII